MTFDRDPAHEMTGEQERFVALHARHLVVRWQWLFRGSMLRATAEGGDVVTITAAGLASLVDAGLVEPIGSAGVRLTDEGRRAAA